MTLHLVDVSLCLVHRQLCLVPLFFRQQDGGLVRDAPGFHVLLQFGEYALRLFQCQIVFPCINGADQFVLLHIQFGAPYVETRFEQRDLVLSRNYRRIGLRLGNLLFGLQQLGTVLIQLEMLLGGIELHHQFALLDGRASVQQMRDLQRASADRRRDHHLRMAGPQFAGEQHFHVEIAALHEHRWDLVPRTRRRGAANGRHYADHGAQDDRYHRPQ